MTVMRDPDFARFCEVNWWDKAGQPRQGWALDSSATLEERPSDLLLLIF